MKKDLQEELFDYFDENEVAALPILAQEILAEFQQLRADRDLYRGLAEQLHQPGPCSFDHHGGCQEHLWLSLEPGEECPDGRAQRLFTKKEE